MQRRGNQMSIDIQRVKAFNSELKRYNEKAATNTAEIEFNNREIQRICSELSTELGISITPDNAEQIYKERVEKTENTLKAGEAILARIKEEEAAEGMQEQMGQMQGQMGQMQGQMGQMQGQPVFNNRQMRQNQPQYNQQQYMQQYAQQSQGLAVDQFKQAPQQQAASGYAGGNMFPSFKVGIKPQQNTENQSKGSVADDIFGNNALEI